MYRPRPNRSGSRVDAAELGQTGPRLPRAPASEAEARSIAQLRTFSAHCRPDFATRHRCPLRPWVDLPERTPYADTPDLGMLGSVSLGPLIPPRVVRTPDLDPKTSEVWLTGPHPDASPGCLTGVKSLCGQPTHIPIQAPKSSRGLSRDVARARCGRPTHIPINAPEASQGLSGDVVDRPTSRFQPRSPRGDKVQDVRHRPRIFREQAP